jgi:RNA polymerase sigma factor (sigma-70 family)
MKKEAAHAPESAEGTAAMASSEQGKKRPGRRPYVMAVMLGTALTALGGPPAGAAPETTLRAVNDLSRYCTTCWRNARLHPDVWTDCTQEVFSRLLERVGTDAWSRLLKDDCEERREFLRAIDTVKKRTQRSKRWAPEPAEGVADRRDLHRRDVADEREAVARAAAELLTERQQRIMQLSFEGWNVHEIAGELRTPPERISDEKYKAIRKLRGRLAGHVA